TLRGAQVDETLARLYLQTRRYDLAQTAIMQAIEIFELADNEVLLAEALTTNGIIASKLGSYNDAQRSFEAAHKISERCRDNEGAGLALLIMLEEIGDQVEGIEKTQVAEKLKRLLGDTQKTDLQTRVLKLLAKIASESKDEG
ncbi:MAG TPA: hypothetical protein VJ656_10945, partial [Pyrinomonadaceae bacterium]|nr:hypothetical protein [Pyrinomonadaceae bacterium]